MNEFNKKRTPMEKKKILDELAGSGLQHGKDYIDDAVNVATRQGEEDREFYNREV